MDTERISTSLRRGERKRRGPKPKPITVTMSRYRRKEANARERQRQGEINKGIIECLMLKLYVVCVVCYYINYISLTKNYKKKGLNSITKNNNYLYLI